MAPSSTTMFDRLSLLLDEDELPISLSAAKSVETSESKFQAVAIGNATKNLESFKLNQDVRNSLHTSKQGCSPSSPTPYVMRSFEESESTSSQKSSPASLSPCFPQPNVNKNLRSPEMPVCVGKLAPPGESFCPILAISRLPFQFVHDKDLSERIGEAFFADGKFWRMDWDIYYIWAPNSNASTPLLLIRSSDAEKFLHRINNDINEACLSLSDTAKHEPGLQLTFNYEHPRLRPRYLGHSLTHEQFTDMSRNCHGETYRPQGEQEARHEPVPDGKELAECKLSVELGTSLCRARAANKAVRQQVRMNKQRNWRHDLKQVERFLGLRPEAYKDEDSEGTSMSWDEYKMVEAQKMALKNPPAINVEHSAPYICNSDAIFISIDIECYERDKRKVTEIGVSTLDTRDLADLTLGPHGSNWFSKIRSRHFRIREYTHLVNKDFVKGCADDFRFGNSEFIRLAEATKILATCFRPPYSAPADSSPSQPTNDNGGDEKRTIVLVGHDVANDLRYMQQMGYDVTNLSTLHPRHPIIDTQCLYRALTQQWNGVKLGVILDEADIAPFGLHNAGNDAAYTMQAMLAIAAKSAGERGSKAAEKRRKAANRVRIAEQARLAIQRALEEADGWSSQDEGDREVEDHLVV